MSSAALAATFRQAMPITERWAYFDHAAVAPLPRASAEKMQRWAVEATLEGDTLWPTWSAGAEECRKLSARLINADPSEIALIPSTTMGISFVAEGWPWQPGDNVVLPADEFPSNQYPWLNLRTRGVEVRRVEMPATHLDLDRLNAACDARTKIVSLSFVGYASGWRTNIADALAIAHRHGAKLFVDAIQGLGAFPLDVAAVPIDFLAADSHKWLLGPEGAGFAYIRREHLDTLRPIGVGWNSVPNGYDYTTIKDVWKPLASRYEGGALNMPGYLAMGESLRLLLEFGPANIGQRIVEYTTELVATLTERGAIIHNRRDEPEHCSGIVTFSLPDQDPVLVRQRCLDRGVVLSVRGGRLRIAAHGYNDASDSEKLSAALFA
jgi:cysteine desulfurase/selenocysteine lyase